MSWLREIRYKDKIMIKRADGSVRVATVNDEPSLTQQSFKDQVDVNNIVKKYQTTGEWLHLTKKQGIYADVSEITDYQESLYKIARAQDAFMSLPGDLRQQFGNDPAQLLAFLQDPANREKAQKMGLIQKQDDPGDTIKNESNESKNMSQGNPQN